LGLHKKMKLNNHHHHRFQIISRCGSLLLLVFIVCVLVQIQIASQRPVPKEIEASGAKEKRKTDRKSANHTSPNYHPVLPNILLVGAQKAGTTALAAWLFRNGVCSATHFDDEPESYEKEVHFFDLPRRHMHGVDFYAKRFERCREKAAILDATPDYLNCASKVSSLYDEWPTAKEHVKILMTLREPVAREVSRYNHYRYKNKIAVQRLDGTAWSFDEWTDHVLIPCFMKDENGTIYNNNNSTTVDTTTTVNGDKIITQGGCPGNYGHYSKHLKEWFRHFDRSQILILSYDEMQRDPKSARSRIQKFLGDAMLSPNVVNVELPKENVKNAPDKVRFPSCASHAKLRDIFAPWNEELYQLLSEEETLSSGNPLEERPFPKFRLGECENSDTE